MSGKSKEKIIIRVETFSLHLWHYRELAACITGAAPPLLTPIPKPPHYLPYLTRIFLCDEGKASLLLNYSRETGSSTLFAFHSIFARIISFDGSNSSIKSSESE
ncbi:hypothetical protein VNO78_16848 [Psophocarpus tetragonolobus]|uniref:Uncharacterized protein n=1 Tax=Psophocarpus tetragonolobus TaxID=3891 RepID=A0AAN9SG56_PSOTE